MIIRHDSNRATGSHVTAAAWQPGPLSGPSRTHGDWPPPGTQASDRNGELECHDDSCSDAFQYGASGPGIELTGGHGSCSWSEPVRSLSTESHSSPSLPDDV
jgi:hypothetical protein